MTILEHVHEHVGGQVVCRTVVTPDTACLQAELQEKPDVVCQHGTAMDVHCCNCHSGFLFDTDSCVCKFESRSPDGDGQAMIGVSVTEAQLQTAPNAKFPATVPLSREASAHGGVTTPRRSVDGQTEAGSEPADSHHIEAAALCLYRELIAQLCRSHTQLELQLLRLTCHFETLPFRFS